MVTEGFWWWVLCHNKSMLYKRCTKQMLEPFIHRSHLPTNGWNGNHSHLPRVSMQVLQECWVLCLPDTDLHKCTHAHLWGDWQSSRLQNTSWLHALHNSLKFGIWCSVRWTTHGRHISSQPCSHSPMVYPSRSSSHYFSDLHYYRLTSLQ